MEDTPFGRYRLTQLLGSGGMSEVWRAQEVDQDTGAERVVAVRMLAPHFAKDPAYQASFTDEAGTASRLQHPHVVPVYDFGEIDGRLYVATPLVDGRDLGAVLRQGPMHPLRAVSIVEQVADAVDAAHRMGIVHRNIKPTNILLQGDQEDWAYLTGFGVAPATTETAVAGSGETASAWAYMAPERFTSADVGPASDIYELTCVLFECVTGSRPFERQHSVEQVAAHLSAPPPQPSRLRPELPQAIDHVIAVGMAKDPRQRYPTAAALAAAARSALTVPQYAPTPPLPPPAPPRARRRTVAIVAGILGVTAALAVTAVVVVTTASPSGHSPAAPEPLVKVGDCIAELPTGETVYSFAVVDCAEPHRGEAYATVTAEDAPTYPGEAVLRGYREECSDAVDFDLPADAGLYLVYPVEDTWDAGNRTIVCIVTTEEPTTGSIR